MASIPYSKHDLTPADIVQLDQLVSGDMSPALRGLLTSCADHARGGSTILLLEEEGELTPNQAAELLKMSRTHLCKLLDRGDIPFRQVGTHRRIAVKDLLAFQELRDKGQKELAEMFTHRSQAIKGMEQELAGLL